MGFVARDCLKGGATSVMFMPFEQYPVEIYDKINAELPGKLRELCGCDEWLAGIIPSFQGYSMLLRYSTFCNPSKREKTLVFDWVQMRMEELRKNEKTEPVGAGNADLRPRP